MPAKSYTKYPFLYLTTFFIVGIIIGKFIHFSILQSIIIFISLSAIILITKYRFIIVIFLLYISSGIFIFTVHNHNSAKHIDNYLHIISGRQLNFSGSVISEPVYCKGKTKFSLSLDKIENYKITGKILIFVKQRVNVIYGDKIECFGRLNKPYPNSNPYSFNYKEYLENKGIYAFSSLYPYQIKIVGHKKNLYSSVIISSRKWLRNRIISLYKENQASFLRAILLGEKQALAPDIKQAFSNSGLSHILAVSGLHTGIISLILLPLFTIFFRNKNIARILTILILTYYIFIANSVPSVQRAVIMINLLLLSQILERKTNPLNTLFVAAFIILTINPNQLFNIGFQLSFLAVLSIITVYKPISYYLLPIREKSSLLYWTITLLTMTSIIQILLAPLTIYYFNQISFGGIIANLFSIPLIGTIIPLSLLSIFLPINFLNSFYISANEFLLFLLFKISHFIGDNHILFMQYLHFNIGQVLSIFLILIISYLLLSNKQVKRKLLVWFLSIIILCVIIFSPDLIYKRELELAILDVGTGDSIFLQTTNKKNILIDCGDKRQNMDYGEKVVFPFLRNKKVKRLDLLVLTHPHSDHIGGAEYIIDNIKVKYVLIPRCKYDSNLYKNLLDKIAKKNISLILADTCIVLQDFQPLKLKVLSPYIEYFDDNINNYSVVLKGEYKKLSFLLMGDLEQEREQWLINTYGDKLDVDLIKIGHHGSNTSTTQEFLENTRPEYSAISVGRYDKFGFPHQEVIKRIEGQGIKLFRTDIDGAIIFFSDGEKLRVKTILSKKNISDDSI